MTRIYTKRGEWIKLHGEEVKRLWRDTPLTTVQLAAMFGVSKGAIGGFIQRQAAPLSKAYVTTPTKGYIGLPVDGLDVSHVDDELAEISQYRHDTAKMLSCAARLCGVSVGELTGIGRAGAKKKWRAAYLMRRMGLSYPRIGQLMSRDQSTAQYGAKRFQATIDANNARDAALRSHVEAA